MLKAKGDKPKAIKVYRGATDVVPKKRKVPLSDAGVGTSMLMGDRDSFARNYRNWQIIVSCF